ncbi:hypothetical protein RUM43_004940 [Polyplax serrata]|uniref:Uncharacterized protein n=1 Tax=Polyplax serrata TaxID=468196 RepID=A0AAN8XMQ6_POLSC
MPFLTEESDHVRPIADFRRLRLVGMKAPPRWFLCGKMPGRQQEEETEVQNSSKSKQRGKNLVRIVNVEKK